MLVSRSSFPASVFQEVSPGKPLSTFYTLIIFDAFTFNSHINAETPGAIHEGGELGYALSVAYGAVMDKPDLIVACVVGDGEAETGPTATAWHAAKYIDPAESGAVIPIVHVNGFKISERTIYGTMDDKEMTALFVYVIFSPLCL
jgi:phosphoketolase